jgi:phosphatidylserine/phosphatidylglycerophosphate/cardiolipin synthase-like enzyme
MRTIPTRFALVFLYVLAAIAGVLAACGQPPPTSLGPAGRDFRLWQDAAIFDCVHQLLTRPGPGQPLWLEMYELGRPDLEEALLTARARGADVRVIVDRTVSVSARAADTLAAAGLPVRAYPVDESRHQIDHVKLLLAGGEALVAGMNWGVASAANHDYALETAVSPVIDRLRAIFLQDWSVSGGADRPLPAVTGPVAETTPGEEVRSALLEAIQRARSSVVAEIYTLTDPEVLAALSEAHRRGVGVRVLIDPGQQANLAAYQLLVAAGVEVRRYPAPPGTLLHAKAGLFDGRELLVGSANWTRSGLSVNHELDLVTEDPAAATAFSRRFEYDWQIST